MTLRRAESDTTKMRGVITRMESCQQTIDGQSFYAYLLAGEGTELADNASLELVYTTGANTNAYLWVVAACGGDAEFAVFEAVTGVTSGSLFVPINRNRQSTTVSTCGVVTGPSAVTTNGTIFAEILPGGQKNHSVGSGGGSEPYVMKSDTSYLFRLTNRAGSAKFAEIQVQWCEL